MTRADSVRVASVVLLLAAGGCSAAAAPPNPAAASNAVAPSSAATGLAEADADDAAVTSAVPGGTTGVLAAGDADAPAGEGDPDSEAATPDDAPAADTPDGSQADLPPVQSEPIPKGTKVIAFGLTGSLTVHEQPADGQTHISLLHNTESLETTGRSKQVLGDEWVEVQLPKKRGTGWVDRRFVGVIGRTDEIASDLPASEDAYVGGDELDIGLRVLDALALRPQGGEPIVLNPVSKKKTRSITFDVRQPGDAMIGVRVRVTAQPASKSDGGVALQRVERTRICSRGVRPGGACL